MAKKRHVLVLVYTDGSVAELAIAKDWTWREVLEHVSLLVRTSGSMAPLPHRLMRDGEFVPLPDTLHAFAWAHEAVVRREEERAAAAVAAEFPTPWKED